MMLTITSQDEYARCGQLSLPHGVVETPAFMPVGTSGAVKAISHRTLREIGYNLILGNSYHLYLRPGTDIIKRSGSLHKFSSWEGNILTDSGGFQLFSLSDFFKIDDEGVQFRSHIDGSYHTFTPEKVVEIQRIFNSDIQMPLDHCTSYGIEKRDAEEAVKRTTAWAKRAVKQWRSCIDSGYAGSLFSIIQGNFFKDLRVRSIEELVPLDTPGIAIGGLSVGEPKELFFEFLDYTAKQLPREKPRYVMGIGSPDYMLEAIGAGIDIFDCVLPTRIARNGSCFTYNGVIALKNSRFHDDFTPIEEGCACSVCQKYTKSYIRHLIKCNEILGLMLTTEHNLHFLYKLMGDAREAIRERRYLSFKQGFLDKFYGDKKP